jgi:predicted transcriptional regulator
MGGLFDRLQDELDDRDQPNGLSVADLLDLPADLAAVIKKIIRKNGMKLADIAAALSQAPDQTEELLENLVEKGFVRRLEVNREFWYKVRFGRKTKKSTGQSVWDALNRLIDRD